MGSLAERRSQVDRSESTRAALADATIDLLVERGWAAVTAVEVCKRVGMTRGAFHHHYPRLATLIADALQRLYDEMVTRERPEPTTLGELIDGTWSALGTPRFKAVLEAWLAMSNDPELRGEIGPVVASFSRLVRPASATSGVLASEEARSFYLMARETLLGLALGRATNRGQPLPHEADVLAQLHRTAESQKAGAATPKRSNARTTTGRRSR